MELLTTNSHYKKHLYFETNLQSKEYALDKCIKILAMIAQLKDRCQSIRNMCEEFYGKSEDGGVKATKSEADKYHRNLEMIKRLRSYYNYSLSKINGFG